MVASILANSDDWAYRNLAILSRGYKRSSKGFQQVMRDSTAAFAGDEPLQMKRKFPAITVAVDKNRIEGCDFLVHPDHIATSKGGRKCKDKDFPASDLIILDDAFQYRALKADINILLVDWHKPVNKDNMMPFGRLRDIPSRITAADAIIATKCLAYLEDEEKLKWVEGLGIKNYDLNTCEGEFNKGKKVKVFFTSVRYSDMDHVFEEGDTRYIYSKKLILFTGIANDTPLRRYLSDKYKIVKALSFPDHHKYSKSDIKKIMAEVKVQPTAVVVTTEKDSQRVLDCKQVPDKLRQRLFRIPVYVDFLSAEERNVFTAWLTSRLRELRSEPV